MKTSSNTIQGEGDMFYHKWGQIQENQRAFLNNLINSANDLRGEMVGSELTRSALVDTRPTVPTTSPQFHSLRVSRDFSDAERIAGWYVPIQERRAVRTHQHG